MKKIQSTKFERKKYRKKYKIPNSLTLKTKNSNAEGLERFNSKKRKSKTQTSSNNRKIEH